MHHSTRNAFTLIELLIVVAIIGILAAIAVPNFLNAQVRAKIARTVANMKTVSTAMESYILDHNSYPLRAMDSFGNANSHYVGFRWLTSPVAYTNYDAFVNPFQPSIMSKVTSTADGRELDPFFEMTTWRFRGNGALNTEFPRNVYLIESSGPDLGDDYGGGYPSAGLLYHPSNGLVSPGDIYRAGGVWVAPWLATNPY